MSSHKVLLINKLIEEGWFEDEKQASAWIMDRKVLVDDQLAFSAKQKIKPDSIIRVKEYYKTKYVNKGGYKLEGALKHFGIDVKDRIALDCGASTGGFTDCLLQHGAAKVYAVDVGYGQIAGKLVNDPRVINMERTNINSISLCSLDPQPEIITLDLSYLSLRKAVPICREILHGCGTVIALIKPLFEVESSEIRRMGKMEDYDSLYQAVSGLCGFLQDEQVKIVDITSSPIRGNGGTIEYFAHLMIQDDAIFEKRDCESLIQDVVHRSLSIEKYLKR